MDDNKKVRDKLLFPQNSLVVTSIDIQSVEPVDQRTRDSLQKSVQLAIEITTNSQEATARYGALPYNTVLKFLLKVIRNSLKCTHTYA
jgi:major vault protein